MGRLSDFHVFDARFILTIWNVNMRDLQLKGSNELRFILTIWNVNNELSKPRS
ncbi:Uncharacterised protein [Clostridioides difficile]|nr:hypothetical protein PCZ31_1945 [Clostridioides difficile]EQF39923.1 hypothetical protein QG3_1940 [Clostridioides difficile CD169]EQF50462.1 hypothetical protein QG9_2506 [Clostridioides difficile CD178]EQG51170.1 hypothetical protein QIY_2561 [Clostridioides difficile DA00141]EQH28639.1 hypothetical protein QM3_2526 [Clostridioides difficile DA00215]EQI72310.1 hypothetical protein QQE_2558 [Clostridioides difficile Y381]EQK00522.1 hypothetical protein QUK_2540 [Clostridioides difficile P